jgi:hypothetical protein
MSVHMTHKVAAHRIFLPFLTDSVQQMLKLHWMMDAQFQGYRQVLGVGCDESNWILSSQVAEVLFAGTWRARLIGSDAFSETGHTRVAMYLLWSMYMFGNVLSHPWIGLSYNAYMFVCKPSTPFCVLHNYGLPV